MPPKRLLPVLALAWACACATPGAQRATTTDTLRALGRLTKESAAQVGSPDALALLGERNAYLILEGGGTLWSIARRLDGERVELDDDATRLVLNQADRTVEGEILLRYRAAPGEAGKLRDLGFLPDHGGKFRRALHVRGTVLPALTFPPEKMRRLKKERVLKFSAPPTASRSGIVRSAAMTLIFAAEAAGEVSALGRGAPLPASGGDEDGSWAKQLAGLAIFLIAVAQHGLH